MVLPEHIVSLFLSLNFFENAVKLCNTDSRREGVRYEVALVSPPCSWATPLSEATFWGFQFLTNGWDSIKSILNISLLWNSEFLLLYFPNLNIGHHRNDNDMGQNKNKVDRCLARYSPRAKANNQPTYRAPNEPANPGKNANFRQNLDVFGQKILIFTGEIKSFVTHITKNHLDTLFALVFGRAWDEMGKKCQYLAQNDQKCIFLTKFWPFLGQKS